LIKKKAEIAKLSYVS